MFRGHRDVLRPEGVVLQQVGVVMQLKRGTVKTNVSGTLTLPQVYNLPQIRMDRQLEAQFPNGGRTNMGSGWGIKKTNILKGLLWETRAFGTGLMMAA